MFGLDLQHASTHQLGGGNVVSPLNIYAPVYHQDWARSKTVHYATDTAANLKQRDHAFTWRTGVMYLVDNGLALYASYSESFFPNISAVEAAKAAALLAFSSPDTPLSQPR